jgi:hypothetical protein
MLIFNEQQNSARRTRRVKTNHWMKLKTNALMKSDLSYREFATMRKGETGEKTPGRSVQGCQSPRGESGVGVRVSQMGMTTRVQCTHRACNALGIVSGWSNRFLKSSPVMTPTMFRRFVGIVRCCTYLSTTLPTIPVDILIAKTTRADQTPEPGIHSATAARSHRR